MNNEVDNQLWSEEIYNGVKILTFAIIIGDTIVDEQDDNEKCIFFKAREDSPIYKFRDTINNKASKKLKIVADGKDVDPYMTISHYYDNKIKLYAVLDNN